MDRHELVTRIGDALSVAAPMRVAVLFGSRAAGGSARPDSDVDVAIVPRDPGLSLWDEGRIAAALEDAVGLPLDLVRLDLASTLLRWEVVKTGVLVLAYPGDAWTRLRIQVMSEHADYAPAAERVARSFLRHLSSTDAS